MSAILGEQVSTHKCNIALSWVFAGLALLFLGVAALLFSLRGSVPADGARMVMLTMLASGLIGVLLLGGAIAVRRGAWQQGELGIARINGPAWRYDDITQAVTFYRGGVPVGLAWRSRDGRLGAVNAHLTRFRQFFDRFWARYIATRAPAMLATLRAGGTCEFAMVQNALAHSFMALGVKSYAQAPTVLVLLSAKTLQAGKLQVPLEQVDGLDVNLWTDKLKFHLQNGQTLSLDYTALYDLPLLLAVLDDLIGASSAAALGRNGGAHAEAASQAN